MKDRSWGCSVTRTCLKNTVIDPAGIPERSQDVNLVSPKRTTRQAEAMPTPTIDQSVLSKEGVDALNKLMLRKLAKDSFLSDAPRKSGDSRDSHCHKKANTWEALREARSTIVSCKCGSHSGKELVPTSSYHHNNTLCMDTTKNYAASFEGGKVTEGVGSLLSRIDLDNRKKTESELPVFQNLSRFDRTPQCKTIVSAQDFTNSIPSKDAGECLGAVSHSSQRDLLPISAEQVSSTSRTDLVNEFTEKNISYCREMPKHRFLKAKLKEGKQRNKNVSWAMEIPGSIGSTGRSKNEDNDQELFSESGMTVDTHSPRLGRKVDANEVITNLQSSNFKSAMHAVGHMWCIPEANSMADAKCSESSPSHRCSARGHEVAIASRSTLGCSLSAHEALDKLAPLQNDFLKLNLKSPVHTEAASEEAINQSSLPIAIPKEMQLRINEAWNLLFEHEGKKQTDSSLVGRGLIRNNFRDEGEEETDLSKTSWPEGLKAAAYVHWNLRDLMQREEIEEDVVENLKALRTAHMLKQGHENLDSRVEELARRVVEKKNNAKQEDGVGGRGNPQRSGIAKSKHEAAQLDDVSRENSETDPNASPRSQFVDERIIQGYPVLEEKTARRIHSSCPGDTARDTSMDAEDDKIFQGKASQPDTKKLIKIQDSCCESAAVRELEVDWRARRDDLEVLLEFLTTKRKLREDNQTNVEAVVQTEAIVREILSRMKLDSDNSSSVDSDASVFLLPKCHMGERIGDDDQEEGGRKRIEKSRCALPSVVTNTSTERDMLEDSDTSEAVSIHQKQKVERFRRPPFVVPSSSKPYNSQRISGSTITRKSTSCARRSCDLSEEYRIATSPSRNPEELKKCSRRSSGGSRQPESRRSIQSVFRNVKQATDVAAEEFAGVASHSKGGKSALNGKETFNGTKCSAQSLLENAENAAITLSKEFSALTNSPAEVPQSSPSILQSARSLESRTFAHNSPARTPLNHQREQQLPVLRASPVKRSTPKSPSSPYHRPCRGSPTRKSSPINRPSPLPSPRRQLKPRPAPCQFESPRPTKTFVADDMSDTLISAPTQDDNIFPTGISEAVVQQSIALAKDSSDPYADFCDSMLEMMQEKNLWQQEEELQDLLQCFLHLNQPSHHQLIHQAFSDVVSFGSPMRYHKKTSRKELRSKALLRHRSSPSRSPARQVWDVSQTKSPARGGG